jgi:hypothetical protein
MYFYRVAELLEEAILQWCIDHEQAPLQPTEITDLAFAMAETLLYRTDFPIDPPTGGELPARELSDIEATGS